MRPAHQDPPAEPTPVSPEPSSDKGPQEPSRLEHLQQELYARSSSDELTTRTSDLQHLGIRRERLPETSSRDSAALTFTSRPSIWRRQRRWLIWAVSAAGLLVLFGIATGVTLWYRALHNVTAADLVLTVSAPEQLTSGQDITYTVSYGNDSRVPWHAVELVFEPPPGFRSKEVPTGVAQSGQQYVVSVGELAAEANGTLTLVGTLVAEENAAAVATAQLTITPDNFPSGRFDTSALATTRITNVPVTVALEMPQEAVPGERVVATITITNSSSQPLSGLYLILQPAPGLNLAPEDAEFSGDFEQRTGRWRLAELQPLEAATRRVVMFVEGQPDERRTLEVQVGLAVDDKEYVQRTASGIISVAASELSLEQQYNKAESPLVVRSGQELHGVIAYANSGTIALNDVVVTAKIEGAAFDPASLKLPAGAYDPRTQTITWTAASVPQLGLLEPQQNGTISYDFSIREAAALGERVAQGNNTVIVTTSIDSPSVRVPVGQTKRVVSSRYVFSVASDLTVAVNAFYDDGRLGITSTGPVPPEAGEETLYTVRLRAGSTVNDIGDVRVVMVLPEGVRHTGQVVTTVGSIEYSERTGEVIWSIPTIPAGSGATAPPVEAHVQVALVPGEHQRGERLPLVKDITAQGTDIFTESQLEAGIHGFSLPTTETAVPGSGKVQ